jgi:hypothetical protein
MLTPMVPHSLVSSIAQVKDLIYEVVANSGEIHSDLELIRNMAERLLRS